MQLLGALDDELSGFRRHVVGDLSAVLSVVHEEHLELLHVVDHELVEPVGQHVAGLLVGAYRQVISEGNEERERETNRTKEEQGGRVFEKRLSWDRRKK